MNEDTKSKLPLVIHNPALRVIVRLSVCLLILVSGVLFYLEGPYSSNIIKPKWYQSLRRSIPGVAKYDQRREMIAIIKSMESTGLVPVTPTNVDSPRYTYEDVGKDLWGTPFRCETTNNLLSIRSAGPDQKYDTTDDMVYRK